MKLHINDIPDDGLEVELRNIEIVSPKINDDLPLAEELASVVSGRVRVTRSGKDIFVFGPVEGSVALTCSRCLDKFTFHATLDVGLTARSRDPLAPPSEGENEEDDSYVFDGFEFDPAEFIAQEIILEIPMKPLCREDCPGLCPHCGKTKSPGECGCEDAPPVDLRWEKLAFLKGKTDPHKDGS
jgi:uncharacterized protein